MTTIKTIPRNDGADRTYESYGTYRTFGLLLLLLLFPFGLQAQIKIGGNVYGGGNKGEVKGNTAVTVRAGDIGTRADAASADTPLSNGKVFGGARIANVGGSTLVTIDGANASGDMVINHVYGGNDIGGEIGSNPSAVKRTAAELAEKLPLAAADGVDNTWNSCVRVTAKMATPDVYYTQSEIEAASVGDPAYGKTIGDLKTKGTLAGDNKKIYIGQLFGGGNGDYTYTSFPGTPAAGKTLWNAYFPGKPQAIASKVFDSDDEFPYPDLKKSYIDVHGGSIVYAYGGGNNATVTEEAVIRVDNPSEVVNHIDDASGNDLLTTRRFRDMGINTAFSHPSSDAYQIGCFFGGNNQATMRIRPKWHLQDGKIRALYSGGNKGAMTYKDGLFLNIPESSTLKVGDLYGGCRMSDVRPEVWDEEEGEYRVVSEVSSSDLIGYGFPKNLAARVIVAGGDVNNVYGGNDVTGRVYFGNAVGIATSIRGNVYGGGNGSYPYTDNPDLQDNEFYSDLYYNWHAGTTMAPSSAEGLLKFRPNAEQVAILIRGKDAEHPTIIGGSVFVGGNCATLEADEGRLATLPKPYPLARLVLGSHVKADKVFLGNNGENMVKTNVEVRDGAGELEELEGVLRTYKRTDIASDGTKFNSMNLTDSGVMETYMAGVAMDHVPNLEVESTVNGRYVYEPYTSYIGSLYYGGNHGSMTYEGPISITPAAPMYIFDKLVAGCNDANVPEQTDPAGTLGTLNARYEGGILGSAAERLSGYLDASDNIKNRVEMNLSKLKIQPMRWKDENNKSLGLEWNTAKWDKTEGEFVNIGSDDSGDDPERRLLGGNIYGGCYESGHVNGNVVININGNMMSRYGEVKEGKAISGVFAMPSVKANPTTGELEPELDEDENEIIDESMRNSGVLLDNQRDDVMAVALTAFGGGRGEDTEIWGSTTVNLNKGYVFQIFGGGEHGVVGKKEAGVYAFNPAYSTTVNLNGEKVVYSNPTYSKDDGKTVYSTDDDLAEAEYLYAAGNAGDVCGNSYVNLGKGRIYDAFGGASDADVFGHTEVYIGRQPDGAGGYMDAFPWVRDIVYGGNDFGGTIRGNFEGGDAFPFTDRVWNYDDKKEMIHGYKAGEVPNVLKGVAYVEYLEGRVDTIFGGGYGYYKYSDTELYGTGNSMPRQHNSFVNIRPKVYNEKNAITGVFGGGTGYPGERNGDRAQDHSYVLIDIPEVLDDRPVDNFKDMEIFGSGSYNGVGMGMDHASTFDPATADEASAVVDLLRGTVGNAYGGSYNEGNTRRTVVNVPEGSTIKIGSIFGGAHGTNTLPPCDVYESHVNYRTNEETAECGAIYGGNKGERRTLYAQVNIFSPVWTNKSKGYLASIYGAGKGENTWSEYTEVNLENGARVFEVYGGGEEGHVLNTESVKKYMTDYWSYQGAETVSDPKWIDAWTLGDYYVPTGGDFSAYGTTPETNLNSTLVRTAEMDDRSVKTYKYNTNVIIKKGAMVDNYAYGGGKGNGNFQSGDVWGSTYIALLGGYVKKDLYAAGSFGGVGDAFRVKNFTATANAYIGGGSARNVYGGSWGGNVGVHTKTVGLLEAQGTLSDAYTNDVEGETHVVVGKADGTSYFDGVPSVERNVYGGGEQGAIIGTTNVVFNNGYVGYRYLGHDAPYHYTYTGDGEGVHPKSDVLLPEGTALKDCYVEKIDDETLPANKYKPGTLIGCGNVFGSGYDDVSSVDKTNVTLYDGVIRCGMFGGGEIAIVGRGTKASKGADPVIHKAGQTNVNMYGGHVLQNVFGGGKGYNMDGYGGGHDRYTDGYVFGQTRVNIYGGEVGTVEGMADGYGNVFGGGDAGFVYSAYEAEDGSLCHGEKSGIRYDDNEPDDVGNYGDGGYYYQHNGTTFIDNNGDPIGAGEKIPTEDCKVLVEPHCKVTAAAGITFDRIYKEGEYVPTSALNTLKDKTTDATEWAKIDDTGIIIHNAVFAGGNTPTGSDAVAAETVTVFGNVTASIHDVYHRDLITIGTGHTGGLYGDGNLTLVDGYRGLNITNYGTDYYNISDEITYAAYKELPAREQAYYELKYICLRKCTDTDGKTYKPADGSLKADVITGDQLLAFLIVDPVTGMMSSIRVDGNGDPVTSGGTAVLLYDDDEKEWVPNSECWAQNGVCSRYAGRIMNTIQRADFCGVFGSRMVMQGARDRVSNVADYTNYTINRVREVSLNKKASVISADTDPVGERYEKHHQHGNYFGIYSNVNFLGALTSDVKMSDSRTTDNTGTLAADGVTSFVEWKENHKTDRVRNRAKSYNKVALASGVYLELTTELSTGDKVNEKDWGYVTGVIELDLINVQQGIGGGFVYAKNVHGVPTYDRKDYATLTALNAGAATRKDYTYADPEDEDYCETSGNFVHDDKTIIDDCYPETNRYYGASMVPAHYWYIKGLVYVYDQYISAYTGSPNAYSETVNIPLTITAASHGTMKLMNVQPNHYAYFANSSGTQRKLNSEETLEVREKEFKLNDPISYWDYELLTPAEKLLFVEKTYVTTAECTVGDDTYPAGYVMLPAEYNALRTASEKEVDDEIVYKVMSHGKEVDFDFIFRESNNLSHETGYILTYDVNNPSVWDVWYTPKTDDATGKITQKAYDGLSKTVQETYHNGPTYKPDEAGLYGQRSYDVAAIISKADYDNYEGYDSDSDGVKDKGLKVEHSGVIPSSGQAEFAPAWFVTKTIDVTTSGGTPAHLYPEAIIVQSDYADKWATMTGSVDEAYVCTSTLELGGGVTLLANTLMSEEQMEDYVTANPSLETDIRKVIQPAYYCTTAGLYGGDYYTTANNYRGLSVLSSMSKTDRDQFSFNYDALDLLIDPLYSKNAAGTIIHREGEKYQYDGEGFTTATQVKTNNKAGYSVEQKVDYSATYAGADPMTYTDENAESQTVIVGQELTREEYEALPNEQRHYSPITVPDDGKYIVHVVTSSFCHGETPYAAGQTIGSEDYKSLNGSDLEHVMDITFDAADAKKTFYFCREAYTIGEHGEGKPVKAEVTGTGIGISSTGARVDIGADAVTSGEIPVGFIISPEGEGELSGYQYGYKSLTNRQMGFTIHGVAPIETSTLYVSRESDIYDLSTEKIITVIYEYEYEEIDESTGDITPVSERHVLNIHIQFESGVPVVEDISTPRIVLPGTLVNLRTPNVKPGAYEVTGGGWMLFEKVGDSESHTNGIPYTPSADPLYWYQNNFWVAYYAQTYLGKTYSNAVQVSVANYHDIAEVMGDANKTHHMYIDYPYVDRDPKIYIKSQDGIDKLKDLFDLSLLTSTSPGVTAGVVTAEGNLEDHALLRDQVKEGQNLEFFMSTDVNHTGTPWSPIAGEKDGEDKYVSCFAGTFHGDGHAITGLRNSLFGKLCGSVYNLGVEGTFTGAGIAEAGSGYVENCWVKTSSADAKTSMPVFGSPERTSEQKAAKGEIQIVNSYYAEDDDATNKYTNHSGSYGIPTRKPNRAFYNGEVAYDLNGFYLYKRYNDHNSLGGSAYTYYQADVTDPLTGNLIPQSGTYAAGNASYSSSGVAGTYKTNGYVEERFDDGDFRYAGGVIPDFDDERTYIDPDDDSKKPYWYPIWPDDYLFFGQALNYGHVDGLTHQNVPTAVNRTDGRIDDTETGNRVYRAPAYFRSKAMKKAYFNPNAVFAQSKKGDASTLAYKDMTAIDFTDAHYGSETYKTYGLGETVATIDGDATQVFYAPLLDDDGLTGFKNIDLTQNLLAYTAAAPGGEPATAADKTANVVKGYLLEPDYSESENYRNVAPEETNTIHGHWVENGTATLDHLLVDKQDFNAPLSYTFASGKRMWYQRKPELYAGQRTEGLAVLFDKDAGWEGVSLPFTAELVTTNGKGELTHFYAETGDGKGPIGHEYWLREFDGNLVLKAGDVYTADFDPISKGTSGTEYCDKTVKNSFLWDHYYVGSHEHLDINEDTYVNDEDYNNEYRIYYKPEAGTHIVNEFNPYPQLSRGMPYLIGFPGQYYYEFDLSGVWTAMTTTETKPGLVEAQTITFASKTAETIGVSDKEMKPQTKDGYTFEPSYLNRDIDGSVVNGFVLNGDGDSYVKVAADATKSVSAFRPHFTTSVGGDVKGYRSNVRAIAFSSNNIPQIYEDEGEDDDISKTGRLIIRAEKGKIIVSSTLAAPKAVRIISAAGVNIDTYFIQPGETVETPIYNQGVYIVNRKKLSVRVK